MSDPDEHPMWKDEHPLWKALRAGKRIRSGAVVETSPGTLREVSEVIERGDPSLAPAELGPPELPSAHHMNWNWPRATSHRAAAVYRRMAIRATQEGEPLGIYAAAAQTIDTAREEEDPIATARHAVDAVGQELAKLYQAGRPDGLYGPSVGLWVLPPGVSPLTQSTDKVEAVSEHYIRLVPAADGGEPVLWMTERAAQWLEEKETNDPWRDAAKLIRKTERTRRKRWLSRFGPDAEAPELWTNGAAECVVGDDGKPLVNRMKVDLSKVTPPDGLLLAGWLPRNPLAWYETAPDSKSVAPLLTVAELLAEVAWKRIVRPRIESASNKHPAINAPTAEQMSMLQRKGTRLVMHPGTLPMMAVLPAGASDVSEPVGMFYVPHVNHEAAVALLENLHSMASHRVLRWVAEQIYAQWERKEDIKEIVFTGGWSEFTAQLNGTTGRPSGPQTKKTRDAALALGGVRLKWGSNETPVITVSELGKSRDRRLVFKPHEPLLPGEVWMTETEQFTQRQKRAHRRLVPLSAEPPLVGRNQEHAAQLGLQMLFLAHVRNNTDRVDGSAIITDSHWEDLAEKAGLPKSILPRVRTAWLKGSATDQPFVELVEDERYRVASNETHGNAALFMAEGASRTVRGRKRARIANRKRAAARSKK